MNEALFSMVTLLDFKPSCISRMGMQLCWLNSAIIEVSRKNTQGEVLVPLKVLALCLFRTF